MSLGKVNCCVHALIEKGWVKARNFRNSKLAYDEKSGTTVSAMS